MNNLLQFLIPTIISLIAAIFSILTYQRNRRFENENYIYKTKHESYAIILRELNNLLTKIQNYSLEFKGYLDQIARPSLSEKKLEELKDEIDALADKADELVYHFDDIVISNSLVIPKLVLTKLEEFTIKLYENDIPDSLDQNQNDLKKLEELISRLLVDANQINEMLRNDLNIESLNITLYRRINN